jgi:hypothetical protein
MNGFEGGQAGYGFALSSSPTGDRQELGPATGARVATSEQPEELELVSLEWRSVETTDHASPRWRRLPHG